MNCACGNPGSVDAQDGDDVVRCVPCRRALHRLQVHEMASVFTPVEHLCPEPPPRFAPGQVGKSSGPSRPLVPDRRLVRRVDTARERVLDLQRRLPKALAEIELLLVDGYADHTPGAEEPPARPPAVLVGPCNEPGCKTKNRPCPEHDGPLALTPVEATVIARVKGTGKLRQLEKAINAIADKAREGLWIVEALTRGPGERPCNQGVGREGQLEWGDPLCDRHHDGTRAGMCDECWEAEADWRSERELEPRERTEPPPSARPMCVRCLTRPVTVGRKDGLCNADRIADSRARKAASR